MDKLNVLSVAVLLSCGFFASSCEKQSDGVMPTLKAATASADVKPDIPVLGVEVGQVWLASEYIVGSAPGTLVDLVCTATKQTGSGTSATWQSYDYFSPTKALAPASTTAYPLAGIPYIFYSPTYNVFDGINYEISRKATWDVNGNVTLQLKVTRKQAVTN